MPSTSAAEQLVDQLSSFRDTGTFSDVTIVCRGRSWKVHRLVIGLHSTTPLENCVAQNGGPEFSIDLSDYGRESVDSLVSCLYTLDYDRGNNPGALDAEMCVMADSMKIPALESLATLKCVTYIRWWDVASLSDDLDKAIKLVRVAYSGGESTCKIREAIVSRLVALRVVADRDRLEGFWSTMTAFPDFAFDLITASASRLPLLHGEVPSSEFTAPYGCLGCHKRNYIDLSNDLECGYLRCLFCHRAWSEDEWMSYPIM